MPDQKPFLRKPPPLIRPQSALGSKHVAELPKQTSDKGFRPWTTHPRQRSSLSTQKVLRPSQQLRRSHLKAKGRQKEPQAVKTAFAVSPESSGLDCPDDSMGFDVVTMVSSDESNAVREFSPEKTVSPSEKDVKQLHPVKRHPSFETWVAGSPHDSDEYNTDLEDGDITLENQARPHLDASGVSVYEEQCKKHGFAPVSYLRRNLGRRSIRMRHHYLGGNAARLLAYAFRHNTVTETLDLSDNYLEASGACFLATMMRDNTFIVSLSKEDEQSLKDWTGVALLYFSGVHCVVVSQNLSNNFIGSRGCAALAEMLDVNTTLKILSVAGNQLNDRDAFHFIEPLKSNVSLSCLDLSHNNLAEMAGLHLAAALRVNDGVNDLDVSWNSIRKSGAVALVNAVKVNTLLEVLDLSWNGIGAEGASALQQCLQVNTTLKVLDLTNNRIDTKSAIKLGAGLKKNVGLETLILNLNPIRDEGIGAILNAADVHRSLKFLSLEELGINTENLQHIRELKRDKKIIILHGGAGGYQRTSSLESVLKLFRCFSREHMTDMEAVFHQQDKDHQGVLTADETKQCLRAAGLRLTSRQLDLIIDEIDFSQCGKIQYREILSGKVFEEYHKRRPSRGFTLSSTFQG